MKAKIINGIKIAADIKSELKRELEIISKTCGHRTPNLTAIQIGEDDASAFYIKNQKANCEALGISYTLLQFSHKSREEEITAAIHKANIDGTVTGVIVHMPLPKHINPMNVLAAINPEKDVEGITPTNLGMLFYHDVNLSVTPCTALSVMECLKETGASVAGKEVVIVGHSEIVGKSLCLMFLSSLYKSATPTVCHIATKNLEFHTKRADILVVAVGKTEFIKGDMVKEGAIVIDVGINRKLIQTGQDRNPSEAAAFKTVGDVDFAEVSRVAGYITPVPGGVGPVTTAILLKNLVSLYKLQNRK